MTVMESSSNPTTRADVASRLIALSPLPLPLAPRPNPSSGALPLPLAPRPNPSSVVKRSP